MPSERPVLVHRSFLERLCALAKGDAKVRRIVEDKLRLLSICPNIDKYGTKLSKTKAKHLYGKLLHADVGKGTRRLFVVVWRPAAKSGITCEILLPCAISQLRSELEYSPKNLAPIIEGADAILESMSAEDIASFVVWRPDGHGIKEEKLRAWPFVKRARH